MRISDKAVAGVASASGLGGLLAAASCCVLPLALAGLGLGASGIANYSRLHAPLSALGLLAVLAGWFIYFRRKRACAIDADCSAPSPITFGLLIAASAFVLLSAVWPFLEAPLMRVLSQ